MFRAGLFAKAVLLLSIASIAMICSTKMAAQMKERTLTCTPLNSDRMKCVTTFEPAVSGGGDWFGPYWDAVSMTPDGYKIESASLDVGGPKAPHRCVVDLNSPIAPRDTDAARLGVAWLPGNPDTQWKNHPDSNGVWSNHQYTNGAWSICYIAQQTDQRVYFRYAIQGIKGHSVAGIEPIKFTPFKVPYWYTTGNQQIAEAAELTAVFVKIAPPAPVWPQAHKVVKGESLTLIA